jgi:hypothetical protein
VTRTRLAAVAVVAAGGLLAGLLLTRDGHSNPAVAHVGGETITRDQLDATVDHFRKAAESEGMPFPSTLPTTSPGRSFMSVPPGVGD